MDIAANTERVVKMSEKRLIDADALWQEIVFVKNCLAGKDKAGEWTKGYRSGLCAVMEEIEDMPTIDAVEVVHGRWEWCREENCVICSECKDEHYIGAFHQYSKNYCPNCGAKMDGDEL